LAQSLSGLPRVNHDTEVERLNLHASDEGTSYLLRSLNDPVYCVARAYHHLLYLL
jgi:hypothetical protein